MKHTSILDFKKSNTPNKISVKVKKSNGGGGEEPKKVDKAPEGFTFLKKEGNKTFYKKVTTKMLFDLKPASQMAGKVGSEKDKKEYFNKMADMVKSGIDPEDLVRKKYIDPSIAIKLKPFFKPSKTEEIVFTEESAPTKPPRVSTPPTPKPITAYDTENLFGPDKKAIGAAILNTRDSKDFAAQQGEVSPTGQDVWFAFYKPNSTQFDESKGLFKIPSSVFGNKITKGTTTINDPAMIEELQKYKYAPKKVTEKMATEVKQELQTIGSNGVGPRFK